MHVLMLSSSRAHNSDYLAPNRDLIDVHLGERKSRPSPAGVSVSYDGTRHGAELHQVVGIHQFADPIQAIAQAEGILVGGGNTFHLLYQLHIQALIAPIQEAVKAGTPYIGWSAGSNICGATISTTNDMPIIEPPSFNALGFVPFQLNPHYTDGHPKDFHGETRDQRLTEFSLLHPNIPIVGIREGSALILHEKSLKLADIEDGIQFLNAKKTVVPKGCDLSHLL